MGESCGDGDRIHRKCKLYGIQGRRRMQERGRVAGGGARRYAAYARLICLPVCLPACLRREVFVPSAV